MLTEPSPSSKPALQTLLTLRHRRLGRISFDEALKLQENVIEAFRATGEGLPVILSLEHDPVITCGRSTDPASLLLTEAEYEKRRIKVRKIDRGGDVTYHGPGQVVVYPIIALRRHALRIGEYVRLLEEAMIRTCADWGVEAFRHPRFRGCWTERGKIGAVGAAVKAGAITKHGLAFNVNPDLSNFKLIVPCGIAGVEVTCLADLTDAAVDWEDVEIRLVGHVADCLGLELLAANERTPL